jgi:prolyl-tRNA synthetase
MREDAMRLANQLFADRYAVPANWQQFQTYTLLERTGFVHFPYAGFPMFLPIGKRMIDKISRLIRIEAGAAGFDEVYLPLVQDASLLQTTGRMELFSAELFALEGKLSRFILCPTNEEFFLDLAAKGLLSNRQLPVRWFQIADKFRNVAKPKGILRSKEFLMCDMVSLDADAASLKESSVLFEQSVQAVFSALHISVIRAEKNTGAYVDFLVPCDEGETFIAIRDGTAHYVRASEPDAIHTSSVAMYFLFNESTQLKHGEGDAPRYHGCVGTYGYGLQRCLHATAAVHRDTLGFAFPPSVRPFDVSIVVHKPESTQQRELANNCYGGLLRSPFAPMLDDRPNKTFAARLALSDFYGVPAKIVVGDQECASRKLTIKLRDQSASFSTPPESLLELLAKIIPAN